MILDITAWVLLVTALIAVLWVWIDTYRRRKRESSWYKPSYSSALWATLWIPAVVGVATVIITVIIGGIAKASTDFTPAGDAEHHLVAKQTKDGQEGSIRGGIFLTVGHLDSERVISYIRESDDGGYLVRLVDADQSVIYESAEESTLTVHSWEKVNPLWTGNAVLDTAETYSFHVPDGSVVNSFEVAP